MTDEIVVGAAMPPIGWSDVDAEADKFGPKGARLLVLPREWTPPFALVSDQLAGRLVRGQLVAAERDRVLQVIEGLAKHTGRVIVRSSAIGETIWERGTFLSELLPETVDVWTALLATAERILASARDRKMALVLQAYIAPDEQGEFGNLLRLSKTRDHWELSVRGVDGVTTSERFNSQRAVAPSTSEPLVARRGLTRARLLAEVAAWTNNEVLRGGGDRVSFEWVRTGSRFHLVQLDKEDEDTSGVNPLQIYIEPSINTGKGGRLVRLAGERDRREWDKLAVLDQLYDDTSPLVPSLYVLDRRDCLPANRSTLIKGFKQSLQRNIVLRTSVKAGADKLTNLKKSDCLTPEEAADWAIEQADLLTKQHPDAELAFVAHRYIAARACAWVRATPGNPVVEVHGTWGLPDALQFCPYDIWEVHIPTEEVTEYPAYKSNVLLLNKDGSWRYERVKNEVARFQSLTKSEVLDIAARTASISTKLQRPCHVMWFAGCKDGDEREANIPWYWVEAHPIEPPEKRASRIFEVTDRETLGQVPSLAEKHRDLGIRLAPVSGDLLRDNDFLKAVADVVAPLDLPVFLTGSTLAHAFFQLTKHGCNVIPIGEKEHLRARKQTSFGKLVRDKIPDRIAAQQEKQRVATIPDQARFGYLVGKLVEEGLEVRDASQLADRLGELADVYEVLRAIAALDGRDMATVEKAADLKKEKAGGFEEGHLLLETSLPTASDGDLSVEGQSSSPAVHQTTRNAIKIPFSAFGFLELGQRVAVRLEELGLLVQVTMAKDGLGVTIAGVEQQLDLELED